MPSDPTCDKCGESNFSSRQIIGNTNECSDLFEAIDATARPTDDYITMMTNAVSRFELRMEKVRSKSDVMQKRLRSRLELEMTQAEGPLKNPGSDEEWAMTFILDEDDKKRIEEETQKRLKDAYDQKVEELHAVISRNVETFGAELSREIKSARLELDQRLSLLSNLFGEELVSIVYCTNCGTVVGISRSTQAARSEFIEQISVLQEIADHCERVAKKQLDQVLLSLSQNQELLNRIANATERTLELNRELMVEMVKLLKSIKSSSFVTGLANIDEATSDAIRLLGGGGE